MSEGSLFPFEYFDPHDQANHDNRPTNQGESHDHVHHGAHHLASVFSFEDLGKGIEHHHKNHEHDQRSHSSNYCFRPVGFFPPAHMAEFGTSPPAVKSG